jgi:hypothetical protein
LDRSGLLVCLFLVDAPPLSAPEAMLKELHEMTTRIERLSQAEHDLIRDVHPKVHEIKEHVENVAEAVSLQNSAGKDASS